MSWINLPGLDQRMEVVSEFAGFVGSPGLDISTDITEQDIVLIASVALSDED